jgi:hypothetical protein
VPAPTAALERLQARKSQIGQQLDGRRAAARFEPEPAADGELAGRELPGDAIAVASEPRVREVSRATGLTPQADAEDYTTRLLKAKQRAAKGRKGPGEGV